MRKTLYLLVLAIAGAAALIVTAQVRGTSALRALENELRVQVVSGRTSEESVTKLLSERGYAFVFVTRAEDSQRSPEFTWSSSAAVGYYVTVVRNIRFNYLFLASEHLRIKIELSGGVVSRLMIEHAFTGL